MPLSQFKKYLAIVSCGFALASASFLYILPAAAQGVGGISDQQIGLQYGAMTGLGAWDVRITAAKIIRVALGLLGMLAVAIVLIGGFTWMTAGGNEEKVGEAKKWVYAGVIGLAIILSAYGIATFVVNSLIQATGYYTFY